MHRFKLDENMPDEVREFLLNLGLDVDTVQMEGLAGAPDDEVGRACDAVSRTLVIFDKGFGDLRDVTGCEEGVILFRFSRQEPGYILPFLEEHRAVFLDKELAGQLVVLNEKRPRKRKLK